MKNKLLIISGIALQCSIVQGQIELGMGAGMSVYRGEIGAHTAASNYVNANVAHGKLATQGFAKFSILPGVKLRANAGYSEYAAFDKYSRDAFFQQRNLSLNGKILDGGLMVEYYPVSRLPVYFTTGIKYGLMSYSVKNANGEVISSQAMGNAKSFVVPVGLGIDVLTNRRGSVYSVEVLTNQINGDVLDGMSTLESRHKDFYSTVTLNYRIPIWGSNDKIKISRSAACGQGESMSRNKKYQGLPRRKVDHCPTF